MAAEELVVHGAREHNLKDVTVRLPRNKLICITGLSGSGKSSLAFDTIYAEGQRRYVESLSAYARQFLQMMEKPDVDLIEICHAYHAAIKRIAGLVPDAVVVVADDDLEQAMALVETVSQSHPGVALLPAGSDHDASIILRSVRAGAREFLPLPLIGNELEQTLRRVCPKSDPAAPAGPRGFRGGPLRGSAGPRVPRREDPRARLGVAPRFR